MHKIFNLKIILYLELKSNYLDVTDNFFIFKKQVLIFFFFIIQQNSERRNIFCFLIDLSTNELL